jgi:hypothetical protein
VTRVWLMTAKITAVQKKYRKINEIQMADFFP